LKIIESIYKLLSQIALRTAYINAGSALFFGLYQPEEPEI